MLPLEKFTNLLKERRYAIEDLERFAELIEPVEDANGGRGYRLKPLKEADRVTQRCQILVQYTWACRDYVKKILVEHGVADAGRVVNGYISASRAIQVISYLANAHKHAGADASQKWAVEIAPRVGKPFVIGQQLSFPHQLKPTLISWGDSLPGMEFTGRAGIGDEVFEFTEFEWRYSCKVEDKDGKPIGNVWGMCEITFQTWLKILTDHGVVI